MKNGVIFVLSILILIAMPTISQAAEVDQEIKVQEVVDKPSDTETLANKIDDSTIISADEEVVEAAVPTKEIQVDDTIILEEKTQIEKQVTSLETTSTATNYTKQSLLSIQLLGLNISLLGENTRENALTSRSLLSVGYNSTGNSSLLKVGLGLAGVGNVNLELVSGSKVVDESGKTYSLPTGLLGVDIKDSALLGDVNIGLLSGKVQDQNNYVGSLASISLNNNLLGKTHLGVIESSKSTIGDVTTTQGGLLLADIENSIIGDGHLGLLETKTVQTPEFTTTQSSLLVGNLNNEIIGNQHLGLLEYQQIKTADSTVVSGGLVILDTKNSPFGDGHFSIGEFEKEDELTVEDWKEEVTSKDQSGQYQSSTEEEESTKGTYTIQSTPVANQIVVDEENPLNSEVKENVIVSEQLTSQKDENNLVANVTKSSDSDNKVASLIKKSNDRTERAFEDLKIIAKQVIDEVNKDDRTPVSDVSGNSSSTTSSSGSSSSSSSSTGNAIVGNLNPDYYFESSFVNKMYVIVKTLSDQWQFSPPSEPPKNPSSL